MQLFYCVKIAHIALHLFSDCFPYITKGGACEIIYSLAAAGALKRKEKMEMKERTLIHIRAEGEECISLRTISRSRKSPHQFYILRDRLEELEKKGQVIAHDINSFAVLRRDGGVLEVTISWLNKIGDKITGYQEMLFLPCDGLSAFLCDSVLEDGMKEWKVLSMDIRKPQTKIIFHSKKNLKIVLKNKIIRRKLIRLIRDGFQWPGTDEVRIYDDCVPYSFYFQEFRNGKPGISGGLVLHGQEDLKNVLLFSIAKNVLYS